MVTQLSGTEQWVFNLERGKALQASAQQQSIGQRRVCVRVCVSVRESACPRARACLVREPGLICVFNVTV